MTDAVDQSWGRIDPAKAKAAGLGLVAGYLSHDPSKNWTPGWIRAYHQHGIGVLLNWESEPGRPLLGAAAGRQDATAAVALAQQLIAQVGYRPGGRIGIVFSCDRDVNPTQWPAIDAYYAATKTVLDAAGFANGVYGEADLIDHLHAAGLTTVEWQTLAWSGGRVSPQTDLYQSSINNMLAGASVDLDQMLHTADLGAWWPPGSVLDKTQSSTTQGGFLMALSDQAQTDMQHQVGVTDANTKLTADLVESILKRVADLQAVVAGQGGTLAALKTSLAALHAAPPGTVDLTSVTAAVNALPAAVRAELHAHPLTLTGAAS